MTISATLLDFFILAHRLLHVLAIMTISATLLDFFILAHLGLCWFLAGYTLLARSLDTLGAKLFPATILHGLLAVILVCGVTHLGPAVRTLCLIAGGVLCLVHILTLSSSSGICSWGGGGIEYCIKGVAYGVGDERLGRTKAGRQ